MTRLVRVAFLVIVGVTQLVTTQVTPATVSDSNGNSADVNSTITWGPLPSGSEYKTDVDGGDDGGLSTYFNMAKSFVDTVAPHDLPYGTLNDLIGGTAFSSAMQSALINWGIGIGICFVLGILFLLIFPIVGCCLCCCRCCCKNCGGKMVQKQKDAENTCKRTVFSIVLFLLTVLIGVGMVCVFVTNDRLGTSMTEIPEVAGNNIDDINTFLNNTVKQVEHLALTNFNFTKKVLFRDLDNMGYLVGEPVKDLLRQAGVQGVLDTAYNFSLNVDNIGTKLLNLNASLEDLKNKTEALNVALDAVRPSIKATVLHANCGVHAGCLAADSAADLLDIAFDPNDLPDISSQTSAVDTVKQTNLTNLINMGKQEFDSIPARVTNETATIVADVKSQANSFDSTIDSAIKGVTDLIGGGNGSSPLDSIGEVKDQITDVSEMIGQYDIYRQYAGYGLTGPVALIVVLLLVGLVLGVCGHKKDALPTERGSLSTCGGHFLMAATGFVFIFGPLLMLLTTLLFMPGAILEKTFCQTLADPNSKLFSEVIDKPGGLPFLSESGYALGQLLLQNDSINLTFGGILTECGRNDGAFSALKLDRMPGLDLSLVENYKDEINITGLLDNININFAALTILDSSTRSQLESFRDALNINFTNFKTELSQNATNASLSDMAAQLEALKSTSTAPIPTQLQSHADELRRIDREEASNVTAAKDAVYQAIVELEQSVQPLPAAINATLDEATKIDNFLGTNASQAVKNEALLFANRLLGVVDSFVNNTMDSLRNDLAGCQPLYNLYMSLTDVIVCRNVVDVLNGFWFGLGWCVVLSVAASIFAVKLAKHFRKMHQLPDDDKGDAENPEAPAPEKSGPPPNTSEAMPNGTEGPSEGYAMQPLPNSRPPSYPGMGQRKPPTKPEKMEEEAENGQKKGSPPPYTFREPTRAHEQTE